MQANVRGRRLGVTTATTSGSGIAVIGMLLRLGDARLIGRGIPLPGNLHGNQTSGENRLGRSGDGEGGIMKVLVEMVIEI